MIETVQPEPPLPLERTARPTKLRISGLNVVFPNEGQPIHVLHDIDLALAEGEFVCILGPSGCGKSTLLNVVGGFLAPTSGRVLIDGEPVVGPDPRRIFVFQERGLFPWLTTEENIGFGLDRLERDERRARIERYVGLVGLAGFERAFPHELSGGMKQRVEVARALAMNPDMLYLDEPFGALDSITRLTLRKELLRIWETERKTILFVTHDIEESVQLADRIIVLSQRPAVVRRIVQMDLPHPRDLSSRRYLELRDSIFDEIGLAHRI
jgi:NitT/TauT family transport system ATP-binding protein